MIICAINLLYFLLSSQIQVSLKSYNPERARHGAVTSKKPPILRFLPIFQIHSKLTKLTPTKQKNNKAYKYILLQIYKPAGCSLPRQVC